MTGKIIEPGNDNGAPADSQPDGIKARERLIVESARCFANAIGISKDIGDSHDHMMAFLQEVDRLRDATSDEWNWPEQANFRDLEHEIRSVRSAAQLLFVVWDGLHDPVDKDGLFFLAESLKALGDRLCWKFDAACVADRMARESAS